MTMERAKEIIDSLANGLNPFDGSKLSNGDICNNPEVVRALCLISNTISIRSTSLGNKKETTTKNRDSTQKRKFSPWTEAEDIELEEEFFRAVPFDEIAKNHERQRNEVYRRLEQLGFIKPKKK